jgi:hypothetical protein
MFHSSANNAIAKQSQRKNLKPGDGEAFTGIMCSDTLSFPTGESKNRVPTCPNAGSANGLKEVILADRSRWISLLRDPPA